MLPNHGRWVRRRGVAGLPAWLAGVLLLLASAPALAQTPARPLERAGPDDLARGKFLFDGQCALCHGIGGGGGSGPSLQRPVLRHAADDEALVTVVRRGVPGTAMNGFALVLTEDDAWRVAAYTRTLGRVTPEELPGDPSRGERLYVTNGCAVCHVVRGDGGVLGPDLSDVGIIRGAGNLRESLIDPGAEHPPGYLTVFVETEDGEAVRGVRLDEDVFWIHLRDESEQTRSYLKSNLAQYRREFGRSLMPEYGAALSAGEPDDLVAYLASLRGAR